MRGFGFPGGGGGRKRRDRDDDNDRAERRRRRRRRRRAAAGGAAAGAVLIGGLIVAAPSDQDFERDVLEIHNEYREQVGCGPLRIDKRLDAAAQAKANDMARHNYLDHNWPNGTKWYENIERHGYHGRPQGENIASGFTTGSRVMAAWRKSPLHWANIKNCAFRVIGIGYNDGYSAVEFGG